MAKRVYTCRVCGIEFFKSHPGRPPAWCSEECRREGARRRAREHYWSRGGRERMRERYDAEHRAAV